ncbi:hypothetical protein LCGC14_1264530 [marine sediment metagenome]|uniref:Uncharacterized protein n=1 Tax=marine sediment metagenome TaxID=412755 RepID=A0A0F9LL35_9ZZZZ
MNVGNADFDTTGTLSELDKGKLLLGLAFYIFGDFTTRLILFRLLNYFTQVGAIQIMPISINPNDIFDYISQGDLYLISGAQRKSTGKLEKYPLSTRVSAYRHLPVLLFGDSFMYLPTGGTNGENNAFNFGYGVLPFLREDFSYSRNIERRDLSRSINQLILDDFSALYDLYKQREGLTDLAFNRVELNTLATNDIMSVVGPKILDHFLAKSGDLDKNLKNAYSVIAFTRKSLMTTTEGRVNDPLAQVPGTRLASIRIQFSNFFKSLQSSATINFNGLVIDGGVFSLNFELSEFTSKHTQLNYNTRPDWWSAFNIDYIEEKNKEIIDQKVDLLVDLIRNLPPQYSKSVRIFIAQNLGTEIATGMDLGYQYLSATTGASDWIPKTPSATGTIQAPSYIDINLASINAWELTKLRYAVLLSLSTERAADGFYNVRDFNFIIKEAGSDFNDLNYIAIFNSERLTQFFPIYSVLGAPSTVRIGRTKVILSGPYGGALLSDGLSSEWSNLNQFIPLWVSTSNPLIRNFEYYKDFITPGWRGT